MPNQPTTTGNPVPNAPVDAHQMIEELLGLVISRDASDLHLSVGSLPTLRVDGVLQPLRDFPMLTARLMEQLTKAIVSQEQWERFQENRELDFALSHNDRERFRVNAYFQRESISVAFRLIPASIRSYDELELPDEIKAFARLKQGLVLFAGPTGHGKSTSQAAIIDDINSNRSDHIITIEDPIEYTHANKQSIVNQRELGSDTKSFANALRASLREDPDVVLIGEMRDADTMAAALTIAETGHLVFATIHTNAAPQTISRIIDSFPAYQQNQVRAQLAEVLSGVVSQRLLPRIGGGRIPAVEIMKATIAVRNLIRENKTHLIPGVIQTASEEGMISMEKALAQRIESGFVKYDDALPYAEDPETFNKLVRRS